MTAARPSSSQPTAFRPARDLPPLEALFCLPACFGMTKPVCIPPGNSRRQRNSSKDLHAIASHSSIPGREEPSTSDAQRRRAVRGRQASRMGRQEISRRCKPPERAQPLLNDAFSVAPSSSNHWKNAVPRLPTLGNHIFTFLSHGDAELQFSVSPCLRVNSP